MNMRRGKEEKKRIIDGRKLKIGIVVSRFHEDLTKRMLSGARDVLRANNVSQKNISVVWTPGTFEIPLACQKIARKKEYDAIVAIGCVIKGGTDHYYYIAGEGVRGVMNVMLAENIPIGLGIITTSTVTQAKDRSGGKENAGENAARAV